MGENMDERLGEEKKRWNHSKNKLESGEEGLGKKEMERERVKKENYEGTREEERHKEKETRRRRSVKGKER